MGAITFDTLKFANTLKDAGVPAHQAEAEARAIVAAIGEVDVATKSDIRQLETKIDADMKLLRWMVGASLAISTGIAVTLMRVFVHLP